MCQLVQRILYATGILIGCASTLTAEDIAQQVRSILSGRCFACHGPDQEKREGGFRLDLRESFLAEADSGDAPIIPGQADSSELLRRIVTSDEDERMPPSDFGAALSPEESALIRSWINRGAKLPQHWSFVVPHRPALPTVGKDVDHHWHDHPVDRFVVAKQIGMGLRPTDEATKAELLRRLSLDLIGLPPTPGEVERFEQDDAPSAYLRQVDRLLASPAFGEHWARKWLDLARYADSSGYADDPMRTIWAYRDWVINALNDNMQLDVFTVDQLAGDLLPDPTTDQLVATAFHRNTQTNSEGGTNDEEFRSVAIVDRVNTTMAVWMGVTMACAQCHTHKYDPFTQEEYFQLYAILNQSQDADRTDDSPILEIFTAEQREQKRQASGRRLEIERQLDEVTPAILDELARSEAGLTVPEWFPLVPASFRSKNKSDADFENDGTIRVLPVRSKIATDTYTIELELGSQLLGKAIHAIGLRTIPHESLPRGGAGLGGGNFVVTGVSGSLNLTSDGSQGEVDAETPEKDAQKKVSVKFVSAHSDYSQNGFPAKASINGDKKSGWAVGGGLAKSHLLTLVLSQPLTLEGAAVLSLQIEHNSSHGNHLLGSFRCEATTTSSAGNWAALGHELQGIHRKPLAIRTKEEQSKLATFFARELANSNAGLREELAKLVSTLAELKPKTTVPILQELEKDARRETFVQIRGNYKSLGVQVDPGTPAVFHPVSRTSDDQRLDRLALARWLVDRDNPLTARVWMNRIWESLFGIGIVRSSEEFGAQGDPPSHPELLDWLACEFMETGWDNKQMLRLIVTSNTYRQSSQVTPAALQADKDNIWLARGPRVRLSAEMVRDQALAAAGLLSRKMYGAPVRPPQPNMGLTAAFGSATDWEASKGEDRYRRGVYTTWRRSNPYPSMATFDAPNREVCILRRDSTNTPLQALVTLNDPGFVEAAQALAKRVVLHSPDIDSDSQRLQTLFEYCTCRAPVEAEVEVLSLLLRQAKEQLSDDIPAATKLASDPLGPLPSDADPVELAAYTAVCNVLLNLDEVLMKR